LFSFYFNKYIVGESPHVSVQKKPIQILPTINEGPEQLTFGDIPEVQLHQPAHISTTAAGPSRNSGAASLAQTGRGAPHQSPSRAPSPMHMLSGNVELDQVQINNWHKEAEEDEVAVEEEELARVQQEIEMLRQEQESILRR
jgi:hypothetical protein